MSIMTGAMRSTPIKTLETTTGLQPLEDRRSTKVLTQATKFKCIQNHPMRERMSKPTKGRLKRSSFIHQSRILERRKPELLDHMLTEIPLTASAPSWQRLNYPSIVTDIPGIGQRETQSELERKSLTLEHIQTVYPEDQWTHAYTDGSAAEAVRDGGGGVYIRYTPRETRIPNATGKYSTNFRAEAAALHTAADHIREHQDEARDQVVIFTDALSVLCALKDPRNKTLNNLNSSLSNLATQVKLTIQWIPAHCGVHGNETADRLAKEGGCWTRTTTRSPLKRKRHSSGASPARNGFSSIQTTTKRTATTA